jgi:hypothetical protein
VFAFVPFCLAIAGSSPANRHLLQTINTGNERCPDGCLRPFENGNGATDYCQQDATMGGLYCTRCAGSLVVKLVRDVVRTTVEQLS